MIAIYCKEHKTSNGNILAACDRELAGKTLKEGEIEFFVSEKFYVEEKITEKELRKKLKSFDNINLVGSRAVGIAIEENIVDKKSVLLIQKVPHAQIFKI